MIADWKETGGRNLIISVKGFEPKKESRKFGEETNKNFGEEGMTDWRRNLTSWENRGRGINLIFKRIPESERGKSCGMMQKLYYRRH